MLCQYKNIFGEPREGAHSTRIPIIDVAFVDVLLTIILAFVISKNTKYSFGIMILILFAVSILLHRIFCVDTRINQLIFSK